MQEKGLKILYIAHERKLGGATLSLLAMMDEMKRHGHQIYAVVPTSKSPIANELRKRKIPFTAVFFAWIQMPQYWNLIMKICFRILYLVEPLQVWYVYHRMKNKGIHIVHSNSSVTDFGAKLAERLHCKHVWHVREFGDADYSLEYLNGRKRTWGYINGHADRLIFISQCLYKYFCQVADSGKSSVIYNGISGEYLLNRNYEKKEKIIFLISGNLTRKKGQMLVLQAARELKQKGMLFELWIAGAASSMSDSKAYERELRLYIEENLSGIAIMLGRVEDMRALREKADVEIVASDMEAFGRVTIEAMLSGMPVIASESGANPELIEDGVNGFLYECGNKDALVERMERFFIDRELIERLGTEAQKRAASNYTLESNVQKIESLYFQLQEGSCS